MFKPVLMAIAAVIATAPAAAPAPAVAQGLAPACLHGPDETPANRDRRQQALLYAARVNAAEGPVLLGRQLQYRPLEELTNLPLLPPGFEIQFHTDVRTYSFSLKDTRDGCHYAIFSDQDRLLYEAVPSKSQMSLVPLGTK